jgi:hypothetical protein
MSQRMAELLADIETTDPLRGCRCKWPRAGRPVFRVGHACSANRCDAVVVPPRNHRRWPFRSNGYRLSAIGYHQPGASRLETPN